MTLILVLMALFIVKHFVCDFILQTSAMVKQKSTYGAVGGLAHAAIHATGTVIILFMVLPWSLPAHLAAAALGTADGVIHYHIDWARSKLAARVGCNSTSDDMFWWLMGADQMLHYLTYVGLIAILWAI